MGVLEQNLEGFLDNNTPGGYIQTNVSISNNDIENIITEKINNRGFLTTETDPTVPAWAKRSTKPTYTAVEVGAMPVNGVSISNTLNNGVTLATITINGVSTDIKGSGNSGNESDPIFTASPAASIRNSDITNWNNKSNFTGNYNDLSNIPTFASVATTGSYYNLKNQPIKIYNTNIFDDIDFQYLRETTTTAIDSQIVSNDGSNITLESFLVDMAASKNNQPYKIIEVNSNINFICLSAIAQTIDSNNIYTFSLSPILESNLDEITDIDQKTDAEIYDALSIKITNIVIILNITTHKIYIKYKILN